MDPFKSQVNDPSGSVLSLLLFHTLTPDNTPSRRNSESRTPHPHNMEYWKKTKSPFFAHFCSGLFSANLRLAASKGFKSTLRSKMRWHGTRKRKAVPALVFHHPPYRPAGSSSMLRDTVTLVKYRFLRPQGGVHNIGIIGVLLQKY